MVEVGHKHIVATEECEQICEKLDTIQKTMQRRKDKGENASELTSKNIEERATQVVQIEE